MREDTMVTVLDLSWFMALDGLVVYDLSSTIHKNGIDLDKSPPIGSTKTPRIEQAKVYAIGCIAKTSPIYSMREI